MLYKKFEDLELSALGFGAMRLPVVAAEAIAVYAITASAPISMASAAWLGRYGAHSLREARTI